MPKKKILIAPLNWGLGHATRCIPIINALIKRNYEPVIASDGEALKLLQKEFKNVEFHELPSYKIKYAEKGIFFGLKLLLQTPHILKTISAEKKQVKRIVETRNIQGIISDNRWGVIYSKVPSVLITHQIRVISGIFTWLSTKIQQNYIRKFDECWVPDNRDAPHLSGKMGHVKNTSFRIKYIGILSRLEKRNLPVQFKYAVILSGPEPQRGLLEKKMRIELTGIEAKVLLVQGIVEKQQNWSTLNNMTVCNFLTSAEMEGYLNSSDLIICRSGYSSLMDLVKLQKKAFLIPTPGQYEQIYLLNYLKGKGLADGCSQEEFSFKFLEKVGENPTLSGFSPTNDLSRIFALFESE